ncbi:MAG: hypothetical protein EZS28_016283, partial [Streblomastix strix]
MSLVVTGLPQKTSLPELSSLFSSHGKILKVKERNKMVFFTFEQQKSAISAQKHLNGEQAAYINKATELYVQNLNVKTTEEELKSHFSQVGTVLSAKIPMSHGKRLNYGFIVLQSEKEAQSALSTLNGSKLGGKKINIEVSRSQRIPVKQQLSSDKQIEQITLSTAVKIEHIFGLSKKSQKQKAELIHQIHQQFEQLNDQQLIAVFNEQLQHTIQLRLGECATEAQCELLNIVEYFALRGSQMAVEQDDQDNSWKTPIFDDMKRYGILKRIKSL